MNKKALRYTALALLIAWMCVIFFFSGQPAEVSDETSDGLVEQLISILYPHFNSLDDFAKQDIVITLVIPIRKLAHLFEFFLLGGLSFGFLSTFTGALKNRRALITLLFGLIYAISDEVHQIFVPGRACQLQDVVIDIFGTFIAILICVMISRIWRRKRREQ